MSSYWYADMTSDQMSLINSLGSSVNILFIINIQTSSTGWTYITLCFFSTCHNGCPVCRESRWKLKLGHIKAPLEALYPHPLTLCHPWSEAAAWQRDQFSTLCLLGGGFNTHSPSSHLPLSTCSGWCLHASMSHLGLPKPVLTAERASWRALTLDGNIVVQGLAEIQIILLIMHSGKQLPRKKGINRPKMVWHPQPLYGMLGQ